VGGIYLAGMAVGIPANIATQSLLGSANPLQTVAASSVLLAVAVVLWLAAAAGDVAHGVLMFPLLRRHSERAAVGYLAARICDALFVAAMALLVVVQIPVALTDLRSGSPGTSSLQTLSVVLEDASQYAYQFGMTAVGVAGLIVCSALLRTGMLPRALALWGLVGYAIILGGSLLEILGFQLHSIQAGPGGLWEVFTGVWLIVKGFRTPPADHRLS
jgi:hypothetical protein